VQLQLHLTKDLIFSVFLPPLVYRAALYIRWREFKSDLPVVVFLPSLGRWLLAAAITAGGACTTSWIGPGAVPWSSAS